MRWHHPRSASNRSRNVDSSIAGTESVTREIQHPAGHPPAANDVDHTKTKVKSSQTNGICERFHKTVLQEFYQVAFRKRLYTSLEQLQADLEASLLTYK